MPNNIPDIPIPRPRLGEPWAVLDDIADVNEAQWNAAARVWERNDFRDILGAGGVARAVLNEPIQPAPAPQRMYRVTVYDDRGNAIGFVERPTLAPILMASLDGVERARLFEELSRPVAPVAPAIRREPRWDPGIRLDGRDREVKSGWKDFEDTIGNVFKTGGYAADKSESFVGLELENETLGEFRLPTVSGWRHHTEGSLRNFGFEYVQQIPARVPDSLSLCSNMLKALKKNAAPQELLNTSRTSTHVHFDVSKYNFKDILNFACTYWILEGYLSYFCGSTRQGNLYCLRLKDSSAIQVLIKSAISEGAPWSMPLSRNDYRYSSLNFASIPKFGSLEFRMMAGSDSLEDIGTWVHALDSIKKFALRFKNPTELGKFFVHDVEARQFPRTVLGAELAHKITSRIHKTPSEIETEIRSGFMMVYPIIAAHGTWDFTKEIKEEEETLKKEREIQKAAKEAERIRFAAIQAARANFPPIPPMPAAIGQDEMNDNFDILANVEVFQIADE